MSTQGPTPGGFTPRTICLEKAEVSAPAQMLGKGLKADYMPLGALSRWLVLWCCFTQQPQLAAAGHSKFIARQRT